MASAVEQPRGLVAIFMGSGGDKPHVDKITNQLDDLGIEHEEVVGSAHKTPEFTLAAIRLYRELPRPIVFVTVAGRADALSAFCDAASPKPVIAAPPYDDKFGLAMYFSSLNPPSGIGLTVVLYPEQAALAAANIFALTDQKVGQAIIDLQRRNRFKIYDSPVNSSNPRLNELLREVRDDENSLLYQDEHPATIKIV